MKWPKATPITAFLAGGSLVVVEKVIDAVFHFDDSEIFPWLGVYFFLTVYIFVLGPNNFPIWTWSELKTSLKAPKWSFPRTEKGEKFYSGV